MMKRLFTLLLSTLFCASGWSQNDSINDHKGAVHFNLATTHIYRTMNIGYESPRLLKIGEKHQWRLSGDLGLWQARLYNPNIGTRCGMDLIYLLGSEKHFLELNAGLGLHLDAGLKGQLLNYIGILPNGFIGYRFEGINNPLFVKAGLGWYEFLQVGIGYRF